MSIDTQAAARTVALEQAQRSALQIVTALAVLGAAVCFGILMVLASFDIALLIISAILVVTAVLAVGIRARWAPVVASVVALSICVGGTFFQPFSLYHLAHPNEYTLFALTVLAIAFGLVAGVTGIAAGFTPRSRGRAAPRWSTAFVTGVAGLAGGALMVGALAGPTIAAAGGAATSTIDLEALMFAPAATTIDTGASLELIDVPDGVPHVLAYGEWVDGEAVADTAEAAPALVNVEVADETSVTVGPFEAAGTYPIFCEIHPGMELAVTVGG